MKVIYCTWLPYSGVTLFPFILLKEKRFANDKVLMNHEAIHLQQQRELLIVPFYIVYLLSYMVNLFRFFNHTKAYRNIIFEKEAYACEKNLAYLNSRKPWSFVNYF